MEIDRWTLAEAAAVPLAPAESILTWGPVLIVAPHPDDEALGCGGLIALLRAAGIPVEIAWLTNGSRSHPGSKAYPREKLISLRREEALASAAILEVSEVHFLGHEDTQVPLPPDPATIHVLRSLLQRTSVVLTPWRFDPHCDHEAAFAYVTAAAEGLAVRVIEYPIWLWENGRAEDRPAKDMFEVMRLDITQVLPTKRAAIAQHRSQITRLIDDDPDGFCVPPHMLEHFRQTWEIFLILRVNSRPSQSIPPEYFERKYGEKLDYWDFATSSYEAAKYAHTMATLSRSSYESGFEIGCSIGILTALLATRCRHLLAVDVSEKALAAARTRSPGTTIRRMQFPRETPEGGRFDLIVLSEVAYYWSRKELVEAQRRILELMKPQAELILVHWTSTETDYPLTGDEVHDSFRSLKGLRHLRGERKEKYRIDLYQRSD